MAVIMGPNNNEQNQKQNQFFCGDGIKSSNAGWSFGGQTPLYFDQHVQRSIPFYEEGHHLVLSLSDFFIQNSSIVYELGTSTGKLIKSLCTRHVSKNNVHWVGIDLEEPMIKKAQEVKSRVEFLVDDIVTHPYQKSDFIVAYYTVQFIPPYLRQELINRIYQSLNWGGAFVLFEKVRAPDARFQDYMTSLYTDFKLDQGHCAEEIICKSKSLKRVLEPFSTQGNRDLLFRAGFVDVMSVYKYVCFEGFLAIK